MKSPVPHPTSATGSPGRREASAITQSTSASGYEGRYARWEETLARLFEEHAGDGRVLFPYRAGGLAFTPRR